MVQINGVEITENLVKLLCDLGLSEKLNKEDKMVLHHAKALMKVNDFLIDYMSDNMPHDNPEELEKVTSLLVSVKYLRDNLMSLNDEFNVISKFN